ncbi:S8 family peptidase [Halobacteriovorax sp. HLS]|uniref:S8 family peptidase n=1 Tax=Halobacteriovorax sp. HLS TaxID=2234000 RepID=UPI000FDCD51B|nr:S8 family peptidase [Halobacteriovorax sp. HLS]
MTQDLKPKFSKMLLSLGLSMALLSMPTMADSGHARNKKSSLSPELLKKVTKKTYFNPKTAIVRDKDSLDLNLLKSTYASWGIDPDNNSSSINLIKAWKNYKKTKDIVVAVIDTGIDPDHPFLKKNIHVLQGKSSQLNYGLDFSKGKVSASKPNDDHGHGTHVAGIIKSVFPTVQILTLKYYNRTANGQDNLNSTIEALDYAVNMGVDIINYSGGGPEPDRRELEILKRAEAKGILVVAAAGNEESNIDNKDNAYYPASYGLKNIITVTAHDQSKKVLSSSNYGMKTVDISAPGYRIKSALPNNRSGYLTGTSQATAFVSGVAALIKSHYPTLTAEQLRMIVKKSARKEVSLMAKCSSGGRLDASKAHTLAAQFTKESNQKRSLAQKPLVKREVAQKFNTKNENGIIYYKKAN